MSVAERCVGICIGYVLYGSGNVNGQTSSIDAHQAVHYDILDDVPVPSLFSYFGPLSPKRRHRVIQYSNEISLRFAERLGHNLQ